MLLVPFYLAFLEKTGLSWRIVTITFKEAVDIIHVARLYSINNAKTPSCCLHLLSRYCTKNKSGKRLLGVLSDKYEICSWMMV